MPCGIVGLTRALAKELGPDGRSVSVEDEQKRTRLNPLRRFATAEDLAHLVLWLGSAHNGYVNGEVVTLSGGAQS